MLKINKIHTFIIIQPYPQTRSKSYRRFDKPGDFNAKLLFRKAKESFGNRKRNNWDSTLINFALQNKLNVMNKKGSLNGLEQVPQKMISCNQNQKGGLVSGGRLVSQGKRTQNTFLISYREK